MHAPRDRTITGVGVIDSNRSEWYFVLTNSVPKTSTVVWVISSFLRPKQTTQVRSEWVVRPRRGYEACLFGMKGVRSMFGQCVADIY